MQILNSNAGDMHAILNLYDKAIAFQKTKFTKHWLPFDKPMLQKEVSENRQWKIMEADKIACIFAIAYEDPFIWREKDIDPSIYIHRIVTNPLFRGKHFVKIIIEWAKQHAKETGKQYIRMDTWGDNERLIEYYVECGFNFLGTTTPVATDKLPKHYSADFLSLFEIKLF